MRTVNEFIEHSSANGFATRANAEKKLAKVCGQVKDERASAVVVQRQSDGRWFPVVINPDGMFLLHYVNSGLWVWS